jgi:hypothetical protein
MGIINFGFQTFFNLISGNGTGWISREEMEDDIERVSKYGTSQLQLQEHLRCLPPSILPIDLSGMWYVEIKPNGTPYTPGRKPFKCLEEEMEELYQNPIYAGGFHCYNCALDVVSFGQTLEGAWLFNHGNDDEKFCAYLGSG